MTTLSTWLDRTGWSRSELARRLGLSLAQVCRLASSNPETSRPISKPIALAIEKVTTDAFAAGEVHEAPLRVADLLGGEKGATP